MSDREPLLLLHSSNFSERYQSNILDFLCYPAGHIVTLRYQSMHVHPDIRSMAGGAAMRSIRGLKRRRRALAIYAETHGDEFEFFPVRFMDVLRLHCEGTVYYVDARLSRFYRYQKDASISGNFAPSEAAFGPLPLKSSFAWSKNGIRRRDSEVPVAVEGRKGYFLFAGSKRTGEAKLTEPRDDERGAWERVVDVISSRHSMRRCIFFSAQLSQVRWRRLSWFDFERVPLEPHDYGLTTRYHAPAASRLELTLLSYRSQLADRGVLPQVLSLELGAEAFGAASHKELSIRNRYNEERVEIPTRRVLERTAGSVRIALRTTALAAQTTLAADARVPSGSVQAKDEPKEPTLLTAGLQAPTAPLLAPELFLFVYVRPPVWALFIILVGAVTAALLLSLGPDSIPPFGRLVERHVSGDLGVWMQTHPGAAAGLSKAVGSVVTLVTGYLGLRRLPVGK